MGAYRNYTIIEDEHGLAARNKAATDFNAALKTEFDEMTKQQVARAKENQKIEGQKQKAKMKASTTLNKKLTEAGLNPQDASAPSSTEAVIKQIKDQYYECAMNPSEECNETMAYLETLPKQIADGIGTQKALTQRYNEIGKIPQGQPNSLDLDRVSSDNFIFGEEFAQNNGANVVCNYDPKSKEIYWTIPGKREPILDENGEIDEDAGYIETLPARMNNKALIESQLDPNNSVDFFPTHGDPAPIVNLMHEGDKEKDLPGLGEGIEGNVLTITKEVKDDEGNVTEEKTKLEGKEANNIIRKRLLNYDFKNTLNSPGAKNLYGDAVKKNIKKLEQIKDKDPNTLTDTEKKILKTWYGDDMKLDDDDPIVKFQANGSAGFGPYIGDDRGQAAQSNIVQLQREILSNGLILDYEDKFLLDEPEETQEEEIVEEEVVEEGGEEKIEGETDLLDRQNDEGETVDKEGNVIPQAEATNLPDTDTNTGDGEIIPFATQSGGMNSYADDKITVFDNTNVDNLSGSPDEVPGLNFMIGIENTVGCMSGGKPVPCAGYGENEEEIKKTITRINEENLGKGTYKDNKGRTKKALNNPTMWGDDWDKLPEEFKTSVLQYNFNSAWDPRVVTMIASGDIDIADRGSYHSKKGAAKLQKKWDEVKGKIDYSKLDNKKLRNEMTDVYKHTYDDKEAWKYNTKKEPTKPVESASQEVKDKYKKNKAQYDKYAAKANPIIKELNILAGKLKTETDPTKKQKLQEEYKKYAKDNNFNFKDGTFLPDNYPSYEARMNLVNKRYKG